MFDRFTPPQTPLLVLGREALTRNLKTMQDLCDAHGVRLRAHGKTHKCSTLGRLQQAGGAVGLCAQTVGEAEAFVKGGITDVLVTAPPAPWGAARLAALAKSARVGSVADSAEQIERLGAAARAAGVTLDLVVDIDPGTHRTGCHPNEAVGLARLAASTEGLNYMGVQAYAGHLQHVAGLEERRVADHAVCTQLAATVAALINANLAPEVVTGGGTGTHSFALASGLFNELQAGSYAVMDVEYADCAAPGGGSWPFEAAMFVAASVVSANHKSHVTVDAGFKAMSMDGPPAKVAAGAAPGSLWRPMGDEHGMIIHPDGLALLRGGNFVEAVETADRDPAIPWPADAPKGGGLVWLQPGHCDPTINLYDALHVVAEDGSFERWAVDARRIS
jgi:D-serine deaminase-like pyridoxal phosphate-dependent protein